MFVPVCMLMHSWIVTETLCLQKPQEISNTLRVQVEIRISPVY